MKHFVDIAIWAARHRLEPRNVDCVTTEMLRILDGKSRLSAAEQRVLTHLYQAVKHRQGLLLGEDVHRVISSLRETPDTLTRNSLRAARNLAESRISRFARWNFIRKLRIQGLFRVKHKQSESSLDRSRMPVSLSQWRQLWV